MLWREKRPPARNVTSSNGSAVSSAGGVRMNS